MKGVALVCYFVVVHSTGLARKEEMEGVRAGKTLRQTEIVGLNGPIRKLKKKQGIRLQIKQKQTRRPKKRRSFITGKRERELGRRNIGDNLKSTQHDTNQHEPTARDGEDVV